MKTTFTFFPILCGCLLAADEPDAKSCCMTPSGRAMLLVAAATSAHDDEGGGAAVHPDMVLIPRGEFTMGSERPESRRNEKPEVKVSVDGFWLDVHDVTNAEFRKFTEATGYKTTAERPINWELIKKQLPAGTPKPPDDALLPGSLVFTPSEGPVDLQKMDAWWTWTHGADWQHPEGPQSNLDGREDHPVVQVS